MDWNALIESGIASNLSTDAIVDTVKKALKAQEKETAEAKSKAHITEVLTSVATWLSKKDKKSLDAKTIAEFCYIASHYPTSTLDTEFVELMKELIKTPPKNIDLTWKSIGDWFREIWDED